MSLSSWERANWVITILFILAAATVETGFAPLLIGAALVIIAAECTYPRPFFMYQRVIEVTGRCLIIVGIVKVVWKVWAFCPLW